MLPEVDAEMKMIGQNISQEDIASMISGQAPLVRAGARVHRALHAQVCISHLPLVYEDITETIALLPDNEITIIVWLCH